MIQLQLFKNHFIDQRRSICVLRMIKLHFQISVNLHDQLTVYYCNIEIARFMMLNYIAGDLLVDILVPQIS